MSAPYGTGLSAPYGPSGRHSLSYDVVDSSTTSERTCKDKRAADGLFGPTLAFVRPAGFMGGTVDVAKRRRPWCDVQPRPTESAAGELRQPCHPSAASLTTCKDKRVADGFWADTRFRTTRRIHGWHGRRSGSPPAADRPWSDAQPRPTESAAGELRQPCHPSAAGLSGRARTNARRAVLLGRHSLSYDPPNSSGGSGRTCKDHFRTTRRIHGWHG